MIELSRDSYDEVRALLDRRLIATVNSNEEVIEAIQDILLFTRAQKISLNTAGELVQGDVDNWLPIDMARKPFEPTLLYDQINGISIGCWWSDRDGFEDGGLGISPTHWMPLPEAPK